MRKTAMICIAILFTTALICSSLVPAASASIGNFNWIGTTAKGYDSFYGDNIVAYEEGTMATLVVSVYNDYYGSDQLNVSAVIVSMDWGINYTSNEASIDDPFVVPHYETHTFSITFTVPSTTAVTNLVTHTYEIYVEHVNSTTGNKEIVGSWTREEDGFVVFSSDQADAFEYKKECESYPYTTFSTVRARELLTQSSVAESMAYYEYTAGDFSSAKTEYQNAIRLLEQAWSNETEREAMFEDSSAGVLKGVENLLTWQAYASILFDIGFLLIGIGAIVYLIRRSAVPKTA